MKRFLTAITACLMTVMLLSGCGSQFPELTDDQYNEVVNYAAGLLTRHSVGTSDKLTHLSADYTPEGMELAEIDNAQAETSAEAADTSPAQEETPAPQEEAPAPQETPAPQEETPGDTAEAGTASDTAGEGASAEETSSEGTAGDGGAGEGTEAAAQDNSRIPEAAGDVAAETPLTAIGDSWLQSLAPGVKVEYVGYSVKSTYPDTETQGAVSAGANERLLILDFRLRNTTGSDVTINTAREGPAYKLVINGYVQGYTLVTMIDNDLSSMVDTLSPDEKLDAVLVMQLPADVAKTVDKLDLRILQGAEMQTVNLE